jgi:pescadillo protein
LSREVPKYSIEYLIISFGGSFGYDGDLSTFSDDDKNVTHHVIDRPMDHVKAIKNREYVQP